MKIQRIAYQHAGKLISVGIVLGVWLGWFLGKLLGGALSP